MRSIFSYVTMYIIAFQFLKPFLIGLELSPETSTPAQNVESIKWYTIEEAIKLNKKEPRKFFIDVYTDWCGWCKKLDQTTFANPTIAAYMNATYYPVKFNAEGTTPITLNGVEYKHVAGGRNGYHELASKWMNGRMSYPTVVFLDEKIELIQPIPGYRDAAEMDKFLKYFGGDHHKKTAFEQFVANYKSPF